MIQRICDLIQFLFEDFLFLPFHMLRFTENWWGANTINILFIIVGILAVSYWIKKLGVFEREERSAYNPKDVE